MSTLYDITALDYWAQLNKNSEASSDELTVLINKMFS